LLGDLRAHRHARRALPSGRGRALPGHLSQVEFFDALRTVRAEAEADVPSHLKDASRDKEGFGHGDGYLYPHAYRDHWVAQQYLPDALQGRVFYQPSDQGHEQTIAAQVARRREEQIAAMVEAPLGAPRVRFTGPKDRARDAWLQRALAAAGRSLGRIRDEIFSEAELARHHLVLDLHAGSGLLTWEALRRAPNGGAWAHTLDKAAAAALAEQVSRLAPVERPAVLLGSRRDLADLSALLDARGDGDVRFDRIVGRGVFRPPADQAPGSLATYLDSLAERLLARLLPGGRLVLAQLVPRRGQRLHALVDWSGASGALAGAVQRAEEATYEGDSSSRGWDAADLMGALGRVGFVRTGCRVVILREERRIGSAVLDRWFGCQDEPPDQGTYGQELANAGLCREELDAVEQRFRAQLEGVIVTWTSGVAILVGSSPEPEGKGG